MWPRCRHDPEQSHLLSISPLGTYYVQAHGKGKAGAALLRALMSGGDGNRPSRYMDSMAQEMGFAPWRK